MSAEAIVIAGVGATAICPCPAVDAWGSQEERGMKRSIVMATLLALVLIGILGCRSVVDDIQAIKREMLINSILHCTSLLVFDVTQQQRIYDRFGVDNGGLDFTSESQIRIYWAGILQDPEFREYLKSIDKDPLEFQKEISDCQFEYLEREGYFDFIRPY